MEYIDLKYFESSSDISLRRVLMVFALFFTRRETISICFFPDTTRSQVFFLEKNFIGVKFIASNLQVRKDNEEICSIL